MSDFNIKAGDFVYCPMATNEVLRVTPSSRVKYETTDGYISQIDVPEDGKWIDAHHNPAIFPATEEWYERLSHVYPNLEKPPIKKSSKEIIQALLDDGNEGVLCWVSDNSIEPTSDNFAGVIVKAGEFYVDYDKNIWAHAIPITPIKSLNQTIIDYVDGKVVLED